MFPFFFFCWTREMGETERKREIDHIIYVYNVQYIWSIIQAWGAPLYGGGTWIRSPYVDKNGLRECIFCFRLLPGFTSLLHIYLLAHVSLIISWRWCSYYCYTSSASRPYGKGGVTYRGRFLPWDSSLFPTAFRFSLFFLGRYHHHA